MANLLGTLTDQLKRPRDDDETLTENAQKASISAAEDGIAVPTKKMRADDSFVVIQKATDVALVAEEGREVDFRDGSDEGQEMVDFTKEEGKGDALKEGTAKGDTGAKLLRGQEENINFEGGGSDDRCDLGETDQEVDHEDGIKEKVKEVKLGADDARGLDEGGESAKREDGVQALVKEVKLGPKVFTSSMDMFNYFHDLLRGWPINFNVNKYEHMMLEDLIKKGHQDAERKVGAGVKAFQIRINPEFYSHCYCVIQKDGSIEDFSYRKCVDTLMPLPDNMKSSSGDLDLDRKGQGGHHNNRGKGGRFGGGGGNRGRGNHGHSGRKRF